MRAARTLPRQISKEVFTHLSRLCRDMTTADNTGVSKQGHQGHSHHHAPPSHAKEAQSSNRSRCCITLCACLNNDLKTEDIWLPQHRRSLPSTLLPCSMLATLLTCMLRAWNLLLSPWKKALQNISYPALQTRRYWTAAGKQGLVTLHQVRPLPQR